MDQQQSDDLTHNPKATFDVGQERLGQVVEKKAVFDQPTRTVRVVAEVATRRQGDHQVRLEALGGVRRALSDDPGTGTGPSTRWPTPWSGDATVRPATGAPNRTSSSIPSPNAQTTRRAGESSHRTARWP